MEHVFAIKLLTVLVYMLLHNFTAQILKDPYFFHPFSNNKQQSVVLKHANHKMGNDVMALKKKYKRILALVLSVLLAFNPYQNGLPGLFSIKAAAPAGYTDCTPYIQVNRTTGTITKFNYLAGVTPSDIYDSGDKSQSNRQISYGNTVKIKRHGV